MPVTSKLNARPRREKYSIAFDPSLTDLEIEFLMIQKGGRWLEKNGKEYGLGLFEHYMNVRALLWPDRYRHRWTDLMYREFLQNSVTVLMGSGSSQKTSHASEFALINYFIWPDETLVILSTTTVDKLEMAIFGETKKLWQAARDRYDWLPGYPVESKHAIATDDIREEGVVRDFRKGIKGIACYVGRQFVGLGAFAGIKQKRIIFVADELQFMAPTFLECLPNLMQNGSNLKVIGSGNPKHDPFDQLGKCAEPIQGWKSLPKIEKTTVWDTKFFQGRCVNLVGTDSPNFDYPENEPVKYPGLINHRSVKAVVSFWGEHSLQFSSQCLGVMQLGMIGNRVITEEICSQHRAFETAKWKNTERIRIYALDPAWGGVNADRCIGGWVEFGLSDEGLEILRCNPPVLVPIVTASNVPPDDQIAQFVKGDAEMVGIEPENIFYDSTGRGTVGPAFARIFGTRVPVPIAFGDKPSRRPVRHDLFVAEPDGTKRLKRCDEYYSKFVTELWFAPRYIIECEQMRELPRDVMEEGTMREYGERASPTGTKIEVEPKEKTIERMGRSPDLFDWLAIACEGARQRGFKIRRLGAVLIENESEQEDYFAQEAERYEAAIKANLLTHI